MSLDSSNVGRRTVTRNLLTSRKCNGTLELYRTEITSGRTPCIFKATETNTSTGADLPDQPVFNALSSLMKYYVRNGKGQREPLKKEFIEKGLGTTCSGRGSTKYWLDATQAGLETAVVVLKFRHGQHKGKTVEIRAHIDK